MFSKSQFKLINSLAQKKYRVKHQLFLAEGKKAISELLHSSFELHSLFTTSDIFEAEKDRTIFLTEDELKKISRFSTPQTALAVFHIPQPVKASFAGLVLALDEVQDPGNLGTIIRLCDWFGVKELICSEGTVDCYNPKVVQATMGSIARVNINYMDLEEVLAGSESHMPVFGAFLEGENVYEANFDQEGILVMGNEANGISPGVSKFIKRKLNIPQFGDTQQAESLNVATATAVLLSEFRRR